jgi:hypothetical protein
MKRCLWTAQFLMVRMSVSAISAHKVGDQHRKHREKRQQNSG